MVLSNFLRLVASLLLVVGLTAHARAGEPENRIRQATDKILSIVSDPALKGPSKAEERTKLIRKVVDEQFDWTEMARRSLGTHWAKRSESEKKEFVPLYAELLERTYLKKVEDYSGEKVLYQGETMEGENATVKVKIVSRKNKDIPVEYRLMKEEKGWFVYDVSIEGVSLVNNYRTQFNSIITQSSYENLLKVLKAKIAEK